MSRRIASLGAKWKSDCKPRNGKHGSGRTNEDTYTCNNPESCTLESYDSLTLKRKDMKIDGKY